MKVKFAPGEGLYPELKRRVDQYFEQTGASRRDSPRIYLKMALILGWFAVSYPLLVFWASTWWQAVPLAISLGLAMAGIGFNIMHDGGHGAFSRSGFINRATAWMLDVLGGSSYMWHWKHNIFHHSYTNIDGADEDVDAQPLVRMTPHQPRYRLHRFQHFYIWLLYGFLPIKWQFVDDFRALINGRIAEHPIPRPRGWSLLSLLLGKALYVGWMFLIPALFHPIWVVGLYFLVVSFTLGITLSVVFTLAHIVEEADFPVVSEENPRCENEWAVHQLQTTVDFARGNRLLSWYLGGLNFQIEHHLFPHISHVHYPALAAIVQSTCSEFRVRYYAHETGWGALKSYMRWLRRMGRPVAASGPAAPATLARV